MEMHLLPWVLEIPDDPPPCPTPAPAPCNEDFRLVESALAGERGDDQRRIAVEGVRWLQLLLCKNRDYGPIVWEEPILAPGMGFKEAIWVRMSDKIGRLRTLRKRASEVTDESIADTISDLGAYCLLWLVSPKAVESPPLDEIAEVL